MTDRLDRIERILETTASRLDQVAEQQKINTTAIAQLEASVNGVAEQLKINTAAIAQVNVQLEASVSDLVRLFLESIEEAEADREAIREMQLEVRGLQSENRRILEYLSTRNGGSSLT